MTEGDSIGAVAPSPLSQPATGRLPAQRSSFVGRERERSELAAIATAHRLVTLVGPGGMGKTRLALRVARGLIGAHPDGVWFIELAPLSPGDPVDHTVLTSLGLQSQPGLAPRALLLDALASREALLLVDNCEHVLDEIAPLVEQVLDGCPGVSVMATSRASLRLNGERVWQVGPLDLTHEAPALFAERARAVQSHFTLDASTKTAVGAICARLDGMPLAIELAAARVRSMTTEELLERLDQRFRLLRSDARASTDRHGTLRAVMDWSYGLLGADLQRLLCALGVFAGGFDLAAAHALRVDRTPITDELDTLDQLDALVDQSLVQVQEQHGRTRYSMLETLRQYTVEQSSAAQRGRDNAAHADHFTHFARRADAQLGGGQQAHWLARMEQEHDNIRAALGWASGPHGDVTVALELSGALGWFWRVCSHLDEGRSWYDRILGAADEHGCCDPTLRCWALIGAGFLDFARGEYPRAANTLNEAAALARETGDDRAAGWALHGLGRVRVDQRELSASSGYLHESISAFEAAGDTRGRAYSLYFLGVTASIERDRVAAEALFEQSRSVLGAVDDRGDIWGLIGVGSARASHDTRVGEFRRAAEGYAEVLSRAHQLSSRWMGCVALFGLAGVAAKQGRWSEATRLHRAARDVRASFGGDPVRNGGASALRHLRQASEALGQFGFEREWEAAATVDFDDAVRVGLEEAARLIGQDSQSGPHPVRDNVIGGVPAADDAQLIAAGLTRRETEVFHLLADGCSNKEIAGQLVLSLRTVENHLAHVYAKLGVRTRVEAVLLALRTINRPGR